MTSSIQRTEQKDVKGSVLACLTSSPEERRQTEIELERWEESRRQGMRLCEKITKRLEEKGGLKFRSNLDRLYFDDTFSFEALKRGAGRNSDKFDVWIRIKPRNVDQSNDVQPNLLDAAATFEIGDQSRELKLDVLGECVLEGLEPGVICRFVGLNAPSFIGQDSEPTQNKEIETLQKAVDVAIGVAETPNEDGKTTPDIHAVKRSASRFSANWSTRRFVASVMLLICGLGVGVVLFSMNDGRSGGSSENFIAQFEQNDDNDLVASDDFVVRFLAEGDEASWLDGPREACVAVDVPVDEEGETPEEGIPEAAYEPGDEEWGMSGETIVSSTPMAACECIEEKYAFLVVTSPEDIDSYSIEELKTRLLEIGFKEENIVFLHSHSKFSEVPTKEHIESRFRQFLDRVYPGDIVLVYLDGLALQLDDSDESYFASDDLNLHDVPNTSVSINEMMNQLADSPAKIRWMLVNDCSGDRSFVHNVRKTIGIRNIPHSISLVYNRRQSTPNNNHNICGNVFTTALLEALSKESNGDLNRDGDISIREICQYVAIRMSELAPSHPCDLLQITPLPENTDDFVLVAGVSMNTSPAGDLALDESFRGVPSKNFLAQRKQLDKLYGKINGTQFFSPYHPSFPDIKFDYQIFAELFPLLFPTQPPLINVETSYSPRITEPDPILIVRREAEQGNAKAQCKLGIYYAEGWEVEQDRKAAVEWWRKAAEQGSVEAQFNLGVYYAEGWEVEQDRKTAVEWWRKAAEQRFVEAQFYLGVCYYNGQGVEQDYKAAVEWWRKAAEQANAQAQYCLGACYAKGKGVDQDDIESVEWYRKAAEQGNAKAQYNLGLHYTDGRGVKQDSALAVEWWHKAAEQDLVEAQFNLGVYYANGLGVEKDDELAFEWWRRAAEQGNAKAQFNLGVCYKNGQGVEKDHKVALEWFRKAAAQGSADARRALSLM